LSATPARPQAAAPLLGQHNDKLATVTSAKGESQ